MVENKRQSEVMKTPTKRTPTKRPLKPISVKQTRKRKRQQRLIERRLGNTTIRVETIPLYFQPSLPVLSQPDEEP
jgi:hypothetical protein